MLKLIALTQLFMRDCHTVDVDVNCSICITLFIILQREPRAANKLIDVAHNLFPDRRERIHAMTLIPRGDNVFCFLFLSINMRETPV